MPDTPRISFVLSTFNRRDVLLDTLAHVYSCSLPIDAFEIHVIDNASTDGTADAVAEAFPHIHLHRLSENRGSCAKNIALPQAAGDFLVFLDDDSYPEPGAIERMIAHFNSNPRLGAATFAITLPDGSQECSAYPNVFIGCGVGLRREAIEQVGGLPEDFFMQAEEYDLSLRLLDAGWDVLRFDDLHVTHLKTPQSRSSPRVMRLDVRNNLLLIARYFPTRHAIGYCIDWLLRYRLIAVRKGQAWAFVRGVAEGCLRALQVNRRPVSDQTFERFTRMDEILMQMRTARRMHELRSIIFVDLGKNVLPYWLAARECRLRVLAIADNRLAGARYRGIPILSDAQAQGLHFDAAIIANSSPVHAAARREQWKQMESRPVIDLLETPPLASNESATVAA